MISKLNRAIKLPHAIISRLSSNLHATILLSLEQPRLLRFTASIQTGMLAVSKQ
jgi:hypothetical protein